MNPKLTQYPLGNADCCLINLSDGRVIVNDYAATRTEEDGDPRIDLPIALRQDLGRNRDNVDVLAISHLDQDHYKGVTETFHLEHAAKYQGNERIIIRDLWVPAAVIVEKAPDAHEAKVIQAEARYRLKEGKGIRVFSRPDSLKDWLEQHDLTIKERIHLITDAGSLVPGFSFDKGGVEIFVHSPFAEAADDGKHVVRNSGSLGFHMTFKSGQRTTKLILGADLDHEDLTGIVQTTEAHGNKERLGWDVAKLSHHCSYLSIGPSKGTNQTQPVPAVKKLYETYGQRGAVLVSSSDVIPSKDTNDPPHRQAASYYRAVAEHLGGQFAVTMEHPKPSAPERLIIEIDPMGARLRKTATIGAAIVSRAAPRVG